MPRLSFPTRRAPGQLASLGRLIGALEGPFFLTRELGLEHAGGSGYARGGCSESLASDQLPRR